MQHNNGLQVEHNEQLGVPMTTSSGGDYRDLLTTRQVCEQWPVLNANTMRYLRHKGEGPASFVVNGRVVYRRSEVEAWLAAQEQASKRGGVA